MSEATPARFIFITVGTPSSSDESIDLTYVMDAIEMVGKVLRDVDDYRLVVVKSTVVPGTTESARSRLEKTSGKRVGEEVGLCANSDFLKEGSAIKDTLEPDKIVIGASDIKSGKELSHLYRLFHKTSLPPIIMTTPQTAEMVKYASNAFLSTKVSFINTMANICWLSPGTDIEDVARAVGRDPRIGSLFLKAGPGYGGGCFPKDLQAFIHYSRDLGYDPKLLQATEQANQDLAKQVVEMARELLGDLDKMRIAILGLSFKRDTDDVREAAPLRIIENLRGMEARIVVYDPMAMQNAKRVLESRVEFASSAKDALKGSDACILMIEWDEFRRIKQKEFLAQMRTPNTVDARRLYKPADYQGMRFVATGLGTDVYSESTRTTDSN